MEKVNDIIDSFSLRETLNPKVWENPEDAKDAKMKSKVKRALLKIADAFIDSLGDDIKVEDIILTGSLANYNWSKFSDFDLHVVIDFSQFKKQEDLHKELFNLKKQLFNEKHDIVIFGYEVELYAQDAKEAHYSSGVYSISDDKWLNVPERENSKIDRDLLETKILSWKQKLQNLILQIKKDGVEKTESKILALKDKLKEYRTSGLEKEGEYSYENLVFKYLRRSGLIEKLYDTINNQMDKELSVEVKNID